MFEALNAILTEGLQNVDVIIQNHVQKQKGASRASWGANTEITNTIISLKEVAKLLSNTGVKLVLLLRASPSDIALRSLLDELASQTNIFIAQYFQFLTYQYADCLFDAVSRAVRTMLSHVKDLVNAVQGRNEDALNYMVGIIAKISEQMGKIPETNKLAYRLLFVEQCISVKETVQEFKGYLEEASEKKAAALSEEVASISLRDESNTEATDSKGKSESDREEDYDEDEANDEFDPNGNGDEEDELDYTPKEVEVVEDGVRLLGKALGCMKHALQIATAVCDAVNSEATSNFTPTTIFATANVTGTGVSASDENEIVTYSNQWIAELAHLALLLKKDVLDLGAELYPPFESDCTVIEQRFKLLREHCADYLRLLDAPALRRLQTPENSSKIAQLVREVEECSLRV